LTLARDGASVVVNYQKDVKAAEATALAITSTGMTLIIPSFFEN
jgi:hypothetical protein